MNEKGSDGNVTQRFALRIILPSVIAILLFIAAMFVLIIPEFEQRAVDDKKEMIRELTLAAESILEEYHKKEKSGEWTRERAQQEAIDRIRDMRYGPKNKDYFWISDMTPTMIVHPYRPELNGKDLSDFEEYNGRKVFVEFAEIVRKQGQGYDVYRWQWKDNPNRVSRKLSYVHGFEPWNWIIGTGIYLDDVEADIRTMKQHLILVSGVIAIIVAVLLGIVITQSLKIEKKRGTAEDQLFQSHEKYKALVSASTEGLIMIRGNEYFYSNQKTRELFGLYSEREFSRLPMFDPNAELPEDHCSGEAFIHDLVKQNEAPSQAEVTFRKKDGGQLDALVMCSRIRFGEHAGHVLILKDLSSDVRSLQRKREEEREELIVELQTAHMALNLPVKDIAAPLQVMEMNTPIRKLAAFMDRVKTDAVLVQSDDKPVGIVTSLDIANRVVAKERATDSPAFEIMSSPIIDISDRALVFEAILQMQEQGVSHLAVRDKGGRFTGMISHKQLQQLQSCSSATVLRAVEKAETVEEVAALTDRVPHIVKALVDSGARIRNINRVLSQISETIQVKFVKLAEAELGPAPTSYCFMTLGSEGRQEETLITDQDNAIVFEDVSDDELEATRDYFLRLGKLVCTWLDEVGYSFCEGEIMAMNSTWCLSVSEWKRRFTNWIAHSTPKDLLNFNIFFDFRGTAGNNTLPTRLRDHVDALVDAHPAFFLHLAQNCLLYRPPIGLFGSITTKSEGEHSDTFSIKEALKPVINFARIYGLRHKVRESNTLQRLDQLHDHGVLAETTYTDLVDVYEYLMELRFTHQSQAINSGETPNNHINPAKLTSIQLELLKKSFAKISAFQSKLSFDFKGMS